MDIFSIMKAKEKKSQQLLLISIFSPTFSQQLAACAHLSLYGFLPGMGSGPIKQQCNLWAVTRFTYCEIYIP